MSKSKEDKDAKDEGRKHDPVADAGDDGILWIGMDLGTSGTAVASSNGGRENSFSLVGYPRDGGCSTLLGDGPLFGADVVKHRLSLNVYRPLEAGVIKGSDDGKEAEGNLRAARDLVRHAIQLARPEKDQLIYAVIGTPAQASLKNRKAIIDAVADEVDSVMIASEPFTVAYGLEMLTDTLVIDIGAGTTDLCRMHGTMPGEDDQITINNAGDFIDRLFSKLAKKAHPEAGFSENMATQAKEKF